MIRAVATDENIESRAEARVSWTGEKGEGSRRLPKRGGSLQPLPTPETANTFCKPALGGIAVS